MGQEVGGDVNCREDGPASGQPDEGICPLSRGRSRSGSKIEPGDERFPGASYGFGHETERAPDQRAPDP